MAGHNLCGGVVRVVVLQAEELVGAGLAEDMTAGFGNCYMLSISFGIRRAGKDDETYAWPL